MPGGQLRHGVCGPCMAHGSFKASLDWSRPIDAGVVDFTNLQLRQQFSCVERVTGIEPALSAWEADVLPLNYTRVPL
jgi:hypothetical protein